MKRGAVTVAMLSLVVSCSGYLPPHLHLAKAISTTQVAEELGATKLEHSAYHVRLAHDAILRAQDFIRAGEHEKADYMTLRAYNDAELAIALTREATARAAADLAAEKKRASGFWAP